VSDASLPVERHIRVPRAARIYEIGTPGPRTREIWIACHGYGQLAAPFAKALEPLNDGSRLILAPEALSRFYLDDPLKQHGPTSPIGASWMTREDREHEIIDYVEYLDLVASMAGSELAGRDVRVVALGFSQGVATACRWAALGQTAIHKLIIWGGTVPTDLPKDKGDALFRGAELVIVAGRTDRVVPSELLEMEHRSLEERGLHSTLCLYDGGHSLHSATLRQLATDGQ
jgi:predicted esterase